MSGQSLVGQTVGSYQVVERLGAGGMGVVYRAIDSRLNRSVALKVLSARWAEDPQARARFLREARAASALEHPNIVTVHAVDELPDGQLCLVMSFYSGQSLSERLRDGRLPLAEVLTIAVQMAHGLAAAHANGIVHRDVKPSNVMLTRDGLVKLVDFGLAKMRLEELTLTAASEVLGTAAYMSPEQARGLPIDERTDIWSLGVVLYEMVSGKLPFHGSDLTSQLYAVVHEPVPAFECVSPELHGIIIRALQKNPADRFRSMSQMCEELERISLAIGNKPLIMASRQETQETLTLRAESAADRSDRERVRFRKGALGIGLAFVGLTVAALSGPGGVSVRAGLARLMPFARSAQSPHTLAAVLPFTSESDEKLAASAAGLAQTIADRLGQLEGFRDSLSITLLRDRPGEKPADPREGLRRSGANLVLSGDLRRDGNGFQLQIRGTHEGGASSGSRVVTATDLPSLEEKALFEFVRLLKLEGDPQVVAALRSRNPAMKQAYEPYLRGVGYLQRWEKPGNLDAALRELGEAAAADPKFALAQVGLAEASRNRFRVEKQAGDIQHARLYAQRALELQPNLAAAHIVLGEIYQDTTQRDLAVIEFKRALELKPKSAEAILGMAKAYEAMGRAEDANAAYRKAVDLNPYSWTSWNARATYYFRLRNYTEAEANFREALKLTPDNAGVYTNLGVALTRQNKLDEAVKALTRSLELSPTYQAYTNLANIYYLQRKFAEAATLLDKAIGLNNRDFRTWGTRAHALRLAGVSRTEFEPVYARAIELGEAWLRTQPGDTRALSLLATYYAATGNREKAKSLAESSLAKADSDVSIWIDCAVAFRLSGDDSEALKWIRKALDRQHPVESIRADADLSPLLNRIAPQ